MPKFLEMLSLSLMWACPNSNRCYVIFCKNLYKNYDLFLAYKANIVIFLFLQINCKC